MKKIFVSVLLALLIATSALCAIPVSAGKSEVAVVPPSSLEGGIDGGTWVTSGNVKGENDSIVFDGDSSTSAKVTSMTKINDYTEYGIDTIFTAEFTVNIASISQETNNRLAFAFGLSRVSAALGSDGVAEVYFIQDTVGLKMGVSRYFQDTADQSIKQVKIVEAQAVSGLAAELNFTVSVELSAAGVLTVTGQAEGSDSAVTVCDAKTDGNSGYSMEGFVCFGQVGRSNASISDVTVTSYDYVNMETPLEVEENFDNGHYNMNAWFSRSDAGSTVSGGISIDGTALRFRNAANAIFGTRYSYSNFELTFDLLDVQRANEYDENDNLIYPKTEWFGVSLGSTTYNGTFDSAVRGDVMFSFEPTGRYVRYHNYEDRVISTEWKEEYKDKNFWDEANEGKVYNFKISMIDGVFSVYFKEQGDADFPATAFYEEDRGYTPSGYVKLIAYEPAGYLFDNIKIVNKDAEPIPVEITYTENSMSGTEDVEYTDTWNDDDLIANRVGEGSGESSGCNSSLVPACVSVAGVAAVAASAAAVISLRRKQK